MSQIIAAYITHYWLTTNVKVIFLILHQKIIGGNFSFIVTYFIDFPKGAFQRQYTILKNNHEYVHVFKGLY